MYRLKESLEPEERPSFLIRDALDALEEAAKNENIVVNMDNFRCISQGVFHCCLGGSQRLKRLGLIDADITKLWGTQVVSVDTVESSLDCARRGNIDSMFMLLELSAAQGKRFNRTVTDFHISESRFKEDIQGIADDLEKAGW